MKTKTLQVSAACQIYKWEVMSNDIFLHVILLFISILKTDNIAALDRQADPNDHDGLWNHVVATKHKNSMQQEHTTHLHSGIGTFTHCKSFYTCA